MVITLEKARKAIARYAGKNGKCADSDDVREFVKEVVQRMLHKGANGSLRKWCFHTCNGCFTAPTDMATPLKVRIDDKPACVWSRWYEFNSCNESECGQDFCTGLLEQPDRYSTIYDLPACGAYISAVPFCSEDEDAHIIIQGIDMHDREVFVEHMGQEVHGEHLTICKEKPTRSRTKFKKITAVQKSKTRHYVRLYWYDPENQNQGLLAEYRPTETNPCYRRFRVPGVDRNCCTKVTVLGRAKLLDCYHDNDVLPITSISALKTVARQIQGEDNDADINQIRYNKELAEELIEDENQYERTGDDPFDFYCPLSAGSLCNMQ